METITAAQNLTLILKQPTGSLFLSLVNVDTDMNWIWSWIWSWQLHAASSEPYEYPDKTSLGIQC